MAIDTTGGQAATEPAAPARASDLANLPDNDLLKEFGLGSAATPTTQVAATVAEGDAGEDGTLIDADSPYADAEANEGVTAEAAAESAAQAATREKAQEEARAAAPAKALATQFAVFDEAGDELEIPDLKIKFKADGQERDLPLDRVVKLAQVGYYNEQRQQELREFREQLPEIESTIASLQEEINLYRTGWQRVLSGDEAYLAQEQEAYLRATSPEARAERLEAENRALRNGQAGSQVASQAVQFVNTLVPKFEQFAAAAPEVSFEEIVGRFNLLTAPFMVRGQIPPAKFREVERVIDSELKPWIETQNEKRTAKTRTADLATAQAAQAKRQTARAIMPQGTRATGADPVVAPKKYKTASDIFDDLPNLVKGAAQTP